MGQNFTNFAFTPGVRDVQEKYGSRTIGERMENGPDRFLLTGEEKSFISSIDFFFLATVGSNGWPYVQYRGGPKAFLRILDERTLGFADFRGNRQYISVGNIMDESKVALILLNFPRRERLKIWGVAKVEDAADNPELTESLIAPDYPGHVERLITISIEAYDWNCQQHIRPRYTEEEIIADIERFQSHVAPEEGCERCAS
ncbi:MAG: pyridoxamine 5'-phosphate oxidase family protein [Verrucomicrobiales bacterium]|nr:pyridoxamine 5'-phosphate oxidase family protein [Verrucomicrobiales bacterium]